ncbi:class I SAM-dependent methyltransferase [Acinetobacter dispersus]|uniref:class I SAM-dependent methyltransferase n=1 Tax=Acinetobacter dispersus TaxID=70348 RepID=UPI001F4ADF59|nr:class I SAM-dependent methyltransferase [Acinetobacter dispersus]MCH7388963.1 class I SAM-dependent methyltransferase [Acinetobacter dispersus]MCU4337932.1 methyltransferase regulatory domain-containing protein [Acinetobacter dispersus]
MTTTWTNGYQTEVNYTYGYYRDLSPNFQKFCLLLNGIDSPDFQENQTHCELGFGQGVSINIHATCNEAKFYGTDFNPAHAAHANQLAEHSKTEHYFYDDSFEELLNRQDLPMFDSISLHGIWSWISYENQHIILKFIRKFLKPNGIVYISYNCVTGWAANMPIRELFHSHFKFNSKSTNPLQKVSEALSFSEDLLKQNPIFAQRNPNAVQKVADLKQQNPNYLIHEYLNQDWQCFSFQQIVRILDEIKLSYAGSTDLSTHLDNINFSEQHQAFLNAIEHPIFKEQCRDYFANTQFRRDLFIRGKNNLTPLQVQERLRNTAFVLLTAKEQLPTNINGLLGTFNLIEEIYTPIGDKFAQENYRPLTIAELEQSFPQLNYAKILNALVILSHLGLAQPCQRLEPKQETLQQCHRLNHYLLKQASFHQNYSVLISPLTGIGIPTEHFHQLFYRAHFIDGLASASDFAQYVQDVISQLNWLVLDRDGKTVTDREKSLEIIQAKAQLFLDSNKLQIAKQLRLFN